MRDSSTERKYVYTTATVRSGIDDRLCNAELPNGKVILGHLPKGSTCTFEPGMKVNVRLSLCDFSHGQIEGMEPST